MDRLEAWDRHHHYPIEQTKETLLSATACTIMVTGALLGGAAYCTGAMAYVVTEYGDVFMSDDSYGSSPSHRKSKSK